MARNAFLITIVGEVQGVGFRAFIRQKAKRLGLEGWVRNRSDGTVEALVLGAPELVDELIEACGKGPALAKIQEINFRGARDDGSKGFTEGLTI